MRFDNKQALEQFLKEGAVATLGTYPYKSRQTVIINRQYKAEIPISLESNDTYLNCLTLDATNVA